MSLLLPDQLKDMWTSVEQQGLDYQTFELEQQRLLGLYADRWSDALLLSGHSDLRDSIIDEISRYTGCSDVEEIRERCERAPESVANDWKSARPKNEAGVEQFYDYNTSYIYDLMWWHSLANDIAPLAYVTALEFAERHQCQRHLDFGAGVGSGNILFLHNGIQSTYADISSSLLAFSTWRFKLRYLEGAQILDLKLKSLPTETFDMVTAMDVFEHLVDPEQAVEELWRALQPGGFLFGRFGSDSHDDDHPQHIVHDFAPTMRRMQALGFVEVWRDEWLWGNQVFQKL